MARKPKHPEIYVPTFDLRENVLDCCIRIGREWDAWAQEELRRVKASQRKQSRRTKREA